jgi:hypothetical protein
MEPRHEPGTFPAGDVRVVNQQPPNLPARPAVPHEAAYPGDVPIRPEGTATRPRVAPKRLRLSRMDMEELHRKGESVMIHHPGGDSVIYTPQMGLPDDAGLYADDPHAQAAALDEIERQEAALAAQKSAILRRRQMAPRAPYPPDRHGPAQVAPGFAEGRREDDRSRASRRVVPPDPPTPTPGRPPQPAPSNLTNSPRSPRRRPPSPRRRPQARGDGPAPGGGPGARGGAEPGGEEGPAEGEVMGATDGGPGVLLGCGRGGALRGGL